MRLGQVRDGSATTSEAVRRAIQHSQEKLKSAGQAVRDRSEDRRQVEEARLGFRSPDRPKEARINGPVRRQGGRGRRLPKAYCRRRSTTAFTPCSRRSRILMRSSPHRCLRRHGISRLPPVEGEASPKRKKLTRRAAADCLIEAVSTPSSPRTGPTSPILPRCLSPAENRDMIANRKRFLAHAFEYACALNDIDHRLTKAKPPWTNGQDPQRPHPL